MFVKPKDGYIVIDPETKRVVAPEGTEVPDNLYWHRRLRDKDVYLAKKSDDNSSDDSKS